jgi:hypothetical protein
MTKEELKAKLDASQEKVDKRLNLITKTCNKVGLNANSILERFREIKGYMMYASQLEEALGIETEDPNDYRDDEERWTEIYERNFKISSLLDSLYKLRELEKVRDNWKVKYDIQVNKESITKIQVLVDFLNEWKELAYNWYVENCKYAVKVMNNFHTKAYNFLNDNYDWSNLGYREKYDMVKEVRKDFNQAMYESFGTRSRYYSSYVDEKDILKAKNVSSFTQEIMSVCFENQDNESYGQCFGYSENKGQFVLRGIDEELLKKTLEKEAQAKYEDLCNRISAVVGEIEDVSNLNIARDGQLNGIVEGTKGSAKVETIGAGGYNIQCFHYRTLVHKL